MAPTTLALVRRRNWIRASASAVLERLAYARDSERRKARLSAEEDLDGVVLMEVEGALPDARERECEDPLVEGAFMVRVVCAVLSMVFLLVEVLGALPMFESPTNAGAAVVVLLRVVLLANALDSRRVMPMPPVLLGEAVAYRLLPPAAMPALLLPPTALDSGVALDL